MRVFLDMEVDAVGLESDENGRRTLKQLGIGVWSLLYKVRTFMKNPIRVE